MLKRFAVLWLLAAVFVSGWQTVRACTTFCLVSAGVTIVGKNLDYQLGDGLIFVNKRNLEKCSTGFEKPARWTAKYGSVTFNMYGREHPMGGMNEAGLVIENMWLEEAKYPAPDTRPEVGVLEWIQYQLDNFSTAGEVIASDSRLRISDTQGATLHYLVCDGRGECASVEFLEGKMVARSGVDFPVRVMTNTRYDSALDFLEGSGGEENSESLTAKRSSLGRFARAARLVDSFASKDEAEAVDYGFGILEEVSTEDWTRWSIVYDINNRQVRFRTEDNNSVRIVDLAKLDFSCDRPALIYDLARNTSGDISAGFERYTLEKNLALIKSAFSKTDFLQGVPVSTLELLAAHPDKFACKNTNSNGTTTER